MVDEPDANEPTEQWATVRLQGDDGRCSRDDVSDASKINRCVVEPNEECNRTTMVKSVNEQCCQVYTAMPLVHYSWPNLISSFQPHCLSTPRVDSSSHLPSILSDRLSLIVGLWFSMPKLHCEWSPVSYRTIRVVSALCVFNF